MAYHYINYRQYYARFDPPSRTLTIGEEERGAILSEMTFRIRTRDLNHVERIITPADYSQVFCAHEKHLDSNGLSICFAEGPEELPFLTLRVVLSAEEAAVSVEAERDPGYLYELCGLALWGNSPETDTFAVSSCPAAKGLRCAIGPAATADCDSLFDRKTDALMTLSSSPRYHYDYDRGAYAFSVRLTEGCMSFSLRCAKRIMEKRFALRYKPMNNDTVFTRPPVGWMTWYAVRFGANEESVLANSAIQREKLAAYGANAVWVDWEWYHKNYGDYTGDFDTFHPDREKYPHGLGYVAERIKEDGFVPCIWIGASHDVRENEFLKEHPDALLIHRPSWCGDYWFDPTHPAYLNEFIPRVFRQLSEEWGYEAIKWDALPRALDYFDQYHDDFYDPSVTSEQAMRAVVKKARDTVGDKVYLLSCHGEGGRDLTLYSDFFDAARIGADIFSWENFMESGVKRLMKFYPLHNIVTYCDPDNLVVREEFNTYDQAVSRASLFALLGTPITIGDDLRELSDERISVIRRAIPPMNTHPMLLESREQEGETLLTLCAVRTRRDDYLLADVFNLTGRPVSRTLEFRELALREEQEYLVYDVWGGSFLGRIRHGISLELRPCESRVLLIRRLLGRPQLLATSRHITGGAFDLEELSWEEETRTLSGRSRTVPGEPYTVTAYDPASSSPVTLTLEPEGELTEWSISFRNAFPR